MRNGVSSKYGKELGHRLNNFGYSIHEHPNKHEEFRIEDPDSQGVEYKDKGGEDEEEFGKLSFGISRAKEKDDSNHQENRHSRSRPKVISLKRRRVGFCTHKVL